MALDREKIFKAALDRLAALQKEETERPEREAMEQIGRARSALELDELCMRLVREAPSKIAEIAKEERYAKNEATRLRELNKVRLHDKWTP